MKRIVGFRQKSNYNSPLSSGESIVGKKLETGTEMLLDNKWKVIVVSQRLFNNYTIVKTKTKQFEVSTKRLTLKA